MKDLPTTFISGISPGPTGTGRLLEFLEAEAIRSTAPVHMVFGPLGLPASKALWQRGQLRAALATLILKQVRRFLFPRSLVRLARNPLPQHLVLFHLQSIGFPLIRRFLENPRTKLSIYLVDSNFFCARSYNHLPSEGTTCLRCLGGAFEEARVHGCPSLPFPQPNGEEFLRLLQSYVSLGRVRILTQNQNQAELARLHFGAGAMVEVAGIWMSDWQEPDTVSPAEPPSRGYDVVFHGSAEGAKGAFWAIQLAESLPERSFLFPFPCPLGITPMKNMQFRPITWATGLEQACRTASVVLLPSLWSAPVEGALVKSLLCAPAVAVAESPMAFSQEFSSEIVLRLPVAIPEAAERLDSAIQSGWRGNREIIGKWYDELASRRKNLLGRIVESNAWEAS